MHAGPRDPIPRPRSLATISGIYEFNRLHRPRRPPRHIDQAPETTLVPNIHTLQEGSGGSRICRRGGAVPVEGAYGCAVSRGGGVRRVRPRTVT